MGSNSEEPDYQQEEEITPHKTSSEALKTSPKLFTDTIFYGKPFRAQYPINPSWEITKALPSFLPRQSHNSNSIPHSLPVRILTHPEAIKVAYDTVRSLVPTLWKGRKIDYMIHIGMAAGRKYYSIERRAHRDGYNVKDVGGEYLMDDERRKKEGKDWTWYGTPEEILSDVDVDDVARRWRVALPYNDLRVSEDAGRYLCDFIYFSSLAHLTKMAEERRVVFLHVPVASDDAAIKSGIEVTLELIRAIIQSGQMKKVKAAKNMPDAGLGNVAQHHFVHSWTA
ncbi:hypothetical protein B7494_g2381 [Chlorociboria aeruginascens]|nr:hypothetical protein B7494_g2381 [Chlorociboria aeruginascens]